VPAPNYATLNASPEGLIAWLERNLLLVGTLQNSTSAGNLEWVTIEPADQRVTRTVAVAGTNNAPADAWELRKATGAYTNATALRAHICNYVAREKHSVVLGVAAGFCFTTTMNGCSFGIGMAAPDGTVLVTHANTGGRTTSQREQVMDAMQQHGATLDGMLEPALYRNFAPGRNMIISTFGVRTNGGWKFHYQLYEKIGASGRNFKIHGVFPVLTQSITG
jgi:hypothetical protein